MAAFLFLLALGLAGLRWYVLLRAQQVGLRLKSCLRIGVLSSFSSLLLPSAVGGDAVRALMVTRAVRGQQRSVAALWSIAIDRVVGLLGLLLLIVLSAILAWPFVAESSRLRSAATAALVGLLFVMLGVAVGISRRVHRSDLFLALGRIPKVGPVILQISEAMLAYRRRALTLLGALVISVVVHGLYVSVLRLLGLGLVGDLVPTNVLMVVVPLALAAGTLPLTPGGIGVTEVAIDEILEWVGYADSGVLVVMLQFRVIQAVLAVCCFASLGLWSHESSVDRGDPGPEGE